MCGHKEPDVLMTLLSIIDPSNPPVPSQPVTVGPGTYWSVGASIVTVALGVIGLGRWIRKWINEYLGGRIDRSLGAQDDLLRQTTDRISTSITSLTDDVHSLTSTVDKLAARIDIADRRFEDHMRESERLTLRMETHLSDHMLHTPTRRR